MNGTGLDARELALLHDVFRRFPEVTKVVLFGSRAKGTSRPGSDVDLALYGELTEVLISRLAGECDELPLPYTFDLESYDSIRSVELKAHIDRVGKVIYETTPPEAGQTQGDRPSGRSAGRSNAD